MRLTLFRGSDDGFTFIGVIFLLFILLLLIPPVTALVTERMKLSLSVLKDRQALYQERQLELEESGL